MKIRLIALLLVSSCAFAQGTRTWEQSKFDDFEKGTPKGVAIRSDGVLELAPAMKALYTTPSTYIWSIASDDRGNVYAAAGAPARVYRISPDGAASVIFAPAELQVQALVVDKAGVVFAATAPEGKVYRIVPKAGAPAAAPAATAPASQQNSNPQNPAATPAPAVDPNFSSSVFFDPKTKYIWALALGSDGRLYVATGDRGEIFRVERNGVGSVFFKSDEAHIRDIVFDQRGNLVAGSDGSGLVYRISPAGEGFVLYSAPKKEITALAIDSHGNIYAAGAGEKRAASGVPNQGQPSVPIISFPQLGAAAAGNAATPIAQLPIPGLGATGSEIYLIAPDGSPKRIWTSRDDLVYALGFDADGRLIAGTGNKGKIFSIDAQSRFTDLLKLSANQVIGFARGLDGATYAATSNLGKLFALQNSAQRDGTYESDVFDAKIFSRWGRVEARGSGNVEYFARSGNVDNPDRNWSPWKKIDAHDPIFDAPSARFIQWRAVLHSGSPSPAVDTVQVNYLPKNVAPEVDDVYVQVGYKFPATPRTVSQAANSNDQANAQSAMLQNLTPQRDRDSISVRWNAHDDNDDLLAYRLYYRGDNEVRWKLLKDNLADRFYSFDAGLLPDGGYSIRVVASDEPGHSPEESLSADRDSGRFEVDNTPPAVAHLAAVVDADQLHITFSAADSFSVIRRAEFSVDAGEWRYVAPVGEISDARQENYDFSIPVPMTKAPPSTEILEGSPATNTAQSNQKKPKRAPKPAPPVNAPAEEHTIVVRVYDRFDNMGTAKVVVQPSAPAGK